MLRVILWYAIGKKVQFSMADPGNNPNRRRRFAFRKRGQQITDHQTGDIQSDEPITILAGAVLVGNVMAPIVRVAGVLQGTAVADELVVNSGGQIWGDATAASIRIETGGAIHGWVSSPLDHTISQDETGETAVPPRDAAQLDALRRLQLEAGEAIAAHAALEKQFDTRLTEKAGDAINELNALKQELTEARAKITILQQRLDNALSVVEAQEVQLETQNGALAEADELEKQLQTHLTTAYEKQGQLNDALETVQAAKDEKDMALAQALKEIDALNGRVHTLETTLQDSIQHSAEQEDALIHWQELAGATQSQLETLEKEQTTLKRQLEESAAVTGKLREKNSRLEFEWQQTLLELDELRNRIPDNTMEEMQFALADAQQKNAALQNIIDGVEEQALWHKANLDTVQRTLEQSRRITVQQEALLEESYANLAEKETAVAKWKTAVEQMAERMQEQEEKIAALQSEMVDSQAAFEVEIASLQEGLKHKSLQLDAHQAEIDHHLQQMTAQGQRLAEIQTALVERELQLGQANARLTRQAGLLKRMKQMTSERIQQLESQLAYAQRILRQRAAKS